MPFPAPGFPNIIILNTFPFFPGFVDSSFTLVALRNRPREEMAEGGALPSPDTAEQQCLDDHRRGDISINGAQGRKGMVDVDDCLRRSLRAIPPLADEGALGNIKT